MESLVYEVLDGRPLYYRGYEDVLAGEKTLEEIRGSSTLQWILVSLFMEIMIRFLDEKKYWFASDPGVQLDHRNNLSHDVAIYERSLLTPDKINTHYADIPARVAVEIDVKADLSKIEDFNYVNKKTRKLLDFGTDKVIWIFTDTQQVMIAEQTADAWLTMSWHRDLELLDGQTFNIGRYLEEEGIKVEN
ncbi:Uma2 family endonuclease [Larkinella sp.]|uniref:Uma2 family endonuclease n=1 Tax=Larkinella sp. TaxID=2034517 RepID=UPI003BA8EF2C